MSRFKKRYFQKPIFYVFRIFFFAFFRLQGGVIRFPFYYSLAKLLIKVYEMLRLIRPTWSCSVRQQIPRTDVIVENYAWKVVYCIVIVWSCRLFTAIFVFSFTCACGDVCLRHFSGRGASSATVTRLLNIAKSIVHICFFFEIFFFTWKVLLYIILS